MLTMLLLASIYANGQTSYAPNGGPFTPSGDLRVLVIYAGFEGDCSNDQNNGGSAWPLGTNCDALPSFASNLFYDDFTDFASGNTDKTLSNYFYQASRLNPTRSPLRIVGEVYPKRVSISGTSADNYKVFQKIELTDPTFNWSRYDNRINSPDFKYDYSTWGSGDGKIDYVVVIYRKLGSAGYASVGNYTGTGFSVVSNCGFTMDKALFGDVENGVKGLFIHELAHTLINYPHLNNANNVHGSMLFAGGGWGFMENNINFSTNAFEKWYLGWLDIPTGKHITSAAQNGTYTLTDFNTTGDFMVIDLPFTSQRLWVENHIKTNPFEERLAFHNDGCSNPSDPSPQGVLMFVEDMTFSRNTILSALSPSYCNKTKSLHAAGNYDYLRTGSASTTCSWGNNYFDYTLTANPFGQHNDITGIRDNYPTESDPNKITYIRSYNNSTTETGNKRCEDLAVWKRSGVYDMDHWIGSQMAFGNILNQKVGMSYNPAVTNIQTYDQTNEVLSPIYLNGISIKFTGKDGSGNITVEVKYNDTDIERDQRLSGNLVLNDIPDAAIDLKVKSGKTLTIDRTGTPDRITKLNGEFFNPTLLTVKSGAVVQTEMTSIVNIKDNSKVIFENGSTLTVAQASPFTVADEAYLEFNETAQLNIGPTFFTVQPTAELCIKNTNNVLLAGTLTYHSEVWKGSGPLTSVIAPGDYKYLGSVIISNATANLASDITITARDYIEILLNTDIVAASTGAFTAQIGTIQTNCSLSSPRIAVTETLQESEIHLEEFNTGCFRYASLGDDHDHEHPYTTNALESMIIVSPVPSNQMVDVRSMDGLILDVHLNDMSGQIKQSIKSANSLEAKMDISSLPDGVYMLNIKTTMGTVNKKIVKVN
ncbi:hypothetical protein SGRA_1855 [Sporocytophaga myxococcoides]|uniref:Secretion system C-terminal sorting domain-containing protein n=2 Tax=Sporocytophaga myxococcoides TaxID=153721 RepID=A0A098LE88_9BACT|nr:hypothetical protein SGRA_1855 [Sporocytophaga myxococcoides]